MQSLILSTCVASLLTNVAGERCNLVTRHANAHRPEEEPLKDRVAQVAADRQARIVAMTPEQRYREKMIARPSSKRGLHDSKENRDR